MVTKTPTPVLIDTAILSQIVSDILEVAGVPSSKKSACLNKAAARIAGPKHNFGFLTGSETPVVSKAVKGYGITREANPVGRSKAPAEFPNVHAINDTREALVATAIARMPITLLSGQPGDGKCFMAKKAGEAMGLDIRDFTSVFSDDIAYRNDEGQIKINPEVQPQPGTLTIYSDIDRLSDDGLFGLQAAILPLLDALGDGRVVLTTSQAEGLDKRLAKHAPLLLQFVMHHSTSQPVDPLFAEFVKEARRITSESHPQRTAVLHLDPQTGEKTVKTRTGLGTLREAECTVRTHEAAALEASTRVNIDADNLVYSIEDRPNLSVRLLPYLQENFTAVRAGFFSGDSTPKAWEDTAYLLHLLEYSKGYHSDALQAKLREILKSFIDGYLGQHAAGLKAHLDL